MMSIPYLDRFTPYRFPDLDEDVDIVNYEDDSLANDIIDNIDGEVTIHIHGWLESSESGHNKSKYISKGLSDQGYGDEFIGYCWDSYVFWPNAKKKVELVADDLSRHIIRLQENSVTVNITSHSLGARVALYALNKIDNPINNLIFMGGGVDKEDVTERYRETINKKTDMTYNLYSKNDYVLKLPYRLYERSVPIGILNLDINSPKFESIQSNVDNHGSYYTDSDVHKQLVDILS